MLRLRTKTYNLTVKQPSAVKVDPNGFVQVYTEVDKHETLIAVAGPYDFLTCFDPEHVESEEITAPKNG